MGKNMKGIILAGGNGSRLYPNTNVVSKQLLPVYSSPLIYYSLTQLMRMDIRDIIVITNTEYVNIFKQFLGDGSQWGISIKILPQTKPGGLPEAFLIARSEIKNEKNVLILGDNIFHGYSQFHLDVQHYSCLIYGYEVSDPERYGVIELDGHKVLSVEEKPKKPKSDYAAVGLYIFDETVVERAASLKPSIRGELEITDIMRSYMAEDKLCVKIMGRGTVWLDAGTISSLADASNFVEAIEKRSGVKIACPEETALNMGFIDSKQVQCMINGMPNCEYKYYLEKIIP